MDFVSIDHILPDPTILCVKLAAMHRDSVSPRNSQFGLPVVSCHGPFRQPVDWDESWANLFARLLNRLFDFETSLHGPWNEQCQGDFNRLIDHTIPRLLGALQSNGRVIKPCLVHGNLSASTMALNMDNEEPILLGPRILYAHNEYELGGWCRKTGTLPWSFFREYRQHFPPSEPVEEWDDRLRLYSISFNILDLIISEAADIRIQ
ncbi:protein-ribulosamine 3-kinase, chloroplastic [Colletotrichum spaethianum]|uniref:Protein-ribulosamine 3-kinase, chloroplastic n=1 Tax=Colletotrichum spaethianum TaxID=700344 RepID=A0AA37PDA0_9PEZI|nr:protein-ribulosamine 3-kinase, chloroplastic [Colletotrichum spaethianum]GKT50168.1 protein-ribulosamine 3-kinase, chloroplastic [Colletotrichum spaethianum]